MRGRVLALLSAVLVLLVSCVPQVFPEDDLPYWEERPVYGTFGVSYNQAWEAALQVVEDRYPTEITEKNRGLIVTEWVIGASDYLFINFGGTRVPMKIKHKIQLRLTTQSGRTTIRVTNLEKVEKDVISANLEFNGAIYEWVDVPSSTAKELEILERVGQNLEKRRKRARRFGKR